MRLLISAKKMNCAYKNASTNCHWAARVVKTASRDSVNSKPVLLLIAGPNGSGKTTVTITLRRDKWSQDVEYINPDDRASERLPFYRQLQDRHRGLSLQ